MLKSIFKKIGPGIITAALVFGPGSLTINTKLGAEFGFSLLWVIVLAVIFMIAYTNTSARIGISSSVSLMQLVKNQWGKSVAILLGLGIFLITASFQAGNSIGAGLAFAELTKTTTIPWILFFSATALIMLFFRSFYAILEKVMIGLVLIMLTSFLLTLIMSKPHLPSLLSGFIPGIPSGSTFLAIALMASSFSVVGAFYQSYLVQEKGWGVSNMSSSLKESTRGIILLGLLSSMVLMCASSVLHHEGIKVNAASDLGLALEPLFGKFTSTAYMVGFFAASFSSLIGNATIGGSILADAFSLGHKLSSLKVRLLIMGVVLTGAIVAILFGSLPIQLIIFASAVTVIIAPAGAICLLLIANNSTVMGKLVNSRTRNLILIIGLGMLIILAIYNVKTIFF
jgi:Mn2+/Fe2+ NRAMP family transporter